MSSKLPSVRLHDVIVISYSRQLNHNLHIKPQKAQIASLCLQFAVPLNLTAHHAYIIRQHSSVSIVKRLGKNCYSMKYLLHIFQVRTISTVIRGGGLSPDKNKGTFPGPRELFYIILYVNQATHGSYCN